MKLHTFLEYQSGKFKVIKKFLHFTGCGSLLDTFTILTKEGNARSLAHQFVKEQGLSPVEGYDCSSLNLVFRDVPFISTVQDMDKTNAGVDMLSNFLYAFVYPLKYQSHEIYRIDYNVLSNEKQRIISGYNKTRDEFIFSANGKVKEQVSFN